jgi:3-hydroxyisobutyrate dehydrogenase-like beta-hydroxyacid dehydrogenase
MGFPMAKRVVGSGHQVFTTVHRNRKPATELEAAGAQILSTPAEVASRADLIVTVLPADAHVKETVLGENGVIHGFEPGKVLIEMTTCTAFTMREIEESLNKGGGRVLDAPVSGGTPAAANGTLTIMVGGDAALLEECRPLLATMGTNIVHVGGVGQGKVVKIVNQAMAAIHLLAMGEAFALGIKCGADPQVLYDVVKASSGYSKMMDLRFPGFLSEGTFEPGFKLDLMKKDLNLAVDSAQGLGLPLMFASLAAQVFSAASTAGKGERDFAAAAEFLASLSGATLQSVQERSAYDR